MKKAIFHSEVISGLQGLSDSLKKTVGDLLRDLQYGDSIGMPQSRPMPAIQPGCHELRVSDSEKSIRVFYYLKLKDRILVFHMLTKKSQKTPKKEIDKAIIRLKQMLEVENGH